MLAGKITSADIGRQIKAGYGSAKFTTMAGNVVTASVDANRNIVLTDVKGDQSIISRFDAVQNNGMLHTVTTVMIPPAAL